MCIRDRDSNGGNRSPPPLVLAPTTLAAPPRLKRRASVAVSPMSLMRRLSGGRPPRPTAASFADGLRRFGSRRNSAVRISFSRFVVRERERETPWNRRPTAGGHAPAVRASSINARAGGKPRRGPRERLARPGGGDGEHVAPFEHGRNHLCLHITRATNTTAAEVVDQAIAQAQCSELVG